MLVQVPQHVGENLLRLALVVFVQRVNPAGVVVAKTKESLALIKLG